MPQFPNMLKTILFVLQSIGENTSLEGVQEHHKHRIMLLLIDFKTSIVFYHSRFKIQNSLFSQLLNTIVLVLIKNSIGFHH